MCGSESGMTEPSGNDLMDRSAAERDRSRRRCDRSRRGYQPPSIALFAKLHEVARFGGSSVTDSGGGLGNQSGPPFQP